MKTLLHLAISCDGYIAKSNGDSNWVSPIDGKLFIQRAKKAGCLVVGHRTYKQYEGDLFPINQVTNIVLTKKRGRNKDILFATSPQQALSKAKEMGFKNVLIAGGGQTSGTFLKAGLINEIFLTVHPLVLGGGIKVFEKVRSSKKIKLLNSKKLGQGLIQLHYACR